MESGFTEFDVTLRDGRSVHIRAVRPSDEAEFLQAFDRMSPDARYMRFMRFVREPNLDRLRKVLASFPEGGDGIVATLPAADGIDIAGSAVYIVGNDPTTCEFAITVGSEFGGVGLAGTLISALIDIARATPCGLIINELVTNSFKYAFPVTFDCMENRQEPCTIRISMQKTDGDYILLVSDNGIGLPEGLDLKTTQSLGLKLVNFLASHQLRATIDVVKDQGTEFRIRFRDQTK